MSIPSVPYRGRDDGSPAGHTSYHDVHIGGNARAQLGDTYHLGDHNYGVQVGHVEIHLPPDQPQEQKARKDCLDVLYLTNPHDDRAKLISSKTKRTEGTCEWIKGDKLYRSWLDPGSRLLWISGGPGKGKTMLSIFLTEELEEVVAPLKDANLIYYFCDNRDEKHNTAVAILRGLLFQILKECPKMFKCIIPDFETKKRAQDTTTSFEALWRIFESMLRDPDFGTMFCVIDGLDECEEDLLHVLIRNLSEFFLSYNSRPTIGEFNLIVASRELPRPITAKLSSFPRLKLDPDSDDKVNNDIKRFISIKVDELSGIVSFGARFRAHVENALLERAEGTFLWVGFVMNELLQKNTCTEVLETLGSLPKGLPGIYGRMLLQIKEDQQNIASIILRWVTTSLRPLRLAELAAAIRTKSDGTLSSNQVIRDHVSSCGAFVRIDDDRVGLVHQSAKEYLLREGPDDDPILERFRIKQEKANFELARTCFEYIQGEPFSSGPVDLEDMLHLQKFPLLNYAALHWPEHVRRCSSFGEEMLDLSGPFFGKNSITFQNWWYSYRDASGLWYIVPETLSLLHVASYLGILPLAKKLLAQKSWNAIFRNIANKTDSKGVPPLHYATEEGHETVVQLLLDSKADVNAKNSRNHMGYTALHIAASRGHEAMVQLLLNGKADVNIKDNDGQTALHCAALVGHEAVLRLLLGGMANINAKDIDGQTALFSAASRGDAAVVRLLLDGKADVNAKDMFGKTALYSAVQERHEAVVKLLLDGKADVNAINNGEMALHCAARRGYEAVVGLLLDSEADVNAKDMFGKTALHPAAQEGHEAVVKLLLNGKADVNTINNGEMALHCAARRGHEGVVRLLLDSKVDINAKDTSGQTALFFASSRGYEAVVRMLLDAKADVNATDMSGKTALYFAALGGYEAVVRLLLEADVNAINDLETPLFCAASEGYEMVVRLLLDSKADVNAKDISEQTALHYAARRGHEAVVRLLLDSKADVNAKNVRNYMGYTALHIAVSRRDEAVVRLLLDGKADVNTRDGNGETALHCAARGYEAMVRLLLASKADVNAMNDNGETALYCAARVGHKEVVKLLLDSKADGNIKSNYGQTALHCAARKGHKAVVRLLLDSKVDINAKDINGQTALFFAASRGDAAVVQMLLDENTDVNAKDMFGETALSDAAKEGHKAVVRLLLADVKQ